MIAFATLRAHWKLIGLALLLAVVGTLLLKLEARTADRDKWQTRAIAEEQAHKQTVANYRAASEEAQRQAQANVARVKADQAAITERTVNDYQARLAAVDARYDIVRRQIATQAHLSSSDPAPMSIAADATCRAYAGTDCDGLLAKLAIAERQAWNLVALREWVEDQGMVKVEPEQTRLQPSGGR